MDLIKDIIQSFNSALPRLEWMDKSSAVAAAAKACSTVTRYLIISCSINCFQASALRIKVGYPVASPNVENMVSLLRYYSSVRVQPHDFFGMS